LLTITVWLPMVSPYSALKRLVITLNSWIPSVPSDEPDAEASSGQRVHQHSPIEQDAIGARRSAIADVLRAAYISRGALSTRYVRDARLKSQKIQ